jgi:hypothetical protein
MGDVRTKKQIAKKERKTERKKKSKKERKRERKKERYNQCLSNVAIFSKLKIFLRLEK